MAVGKIFSNVFSTGNMKIMLDEDYYIDDKGNQYSINKENNIENEINTSNINIQTADEVNINNLLADDSTTNSEEYSSFGYNCTCDEDEKGSITINCRLGRRNGVELQGAKINLYLLNGISPKLCSSKLSDSDGNVVFKELENGCYRVIAIVDRRYFEKPSYISWNEFTIDSCCKETTITVIYKIKKSCYKK